MPFQCPICLTGIDLKSDKNDKPYLICNDCGVQLFIRGRRGIQRLTELAVLHQPIFSSGESIQMDTALTSELAALQKEEVVVCTKCGIIVLKRFRSISKPLLGESGLYCPICRELLLTEAALKATK